jgi:hypothetical protein
MIAMGLGLPIRDGIPYGFILSVPGAFATVAALLIIFRELTSINDKLTAAMSQETDRADGRSTHGTSVLVQRDLV